MRGKEINIASNESETAAKAVEIITNKRAAAEEQSR
jgi:hypothetical protein